jgi:hypothetical protein
MTDYKCPPPDEPAEQPHNPGGTCYPLPKTPCPIAEPPAPCPPDPYCKCPPKPGVTTTCLENLIESQTRPITEGDKAKTFKTELEGFLGKAKPASLEYTKEKFDKLVEQWVQQDCEIADLVRKLVCAVPCWRCIIECHVCPLLNDMRDAELRLLASDGPPSDVDNLHEQLFWQQQDRAAKERTFNRVKLVLTAWEKPVATIEKALTDNAKLIVDLGKLLGSEASRVVFDVFLRLIPLHLAIAPPRGSDHKTKIAREYTQFCHCDVGEGDYCCGPDVGVLSFRERIIGPQPYLIHPNDYFTLICCLVEHRYAPAKDAVGEAEAAVKTTQNLIKRYEDVIANGLKNFNRDGRAAIPATVNCYDYEQH